MGNQMSIFDFLQNDIEFDVLLEYTKIGSGFANGKKRIYEFFANCDDINKRIKFLKSEYGIGGFGHPTQKTFCIHGSNHDASGISLEWYGANMENCKSDFTYTQLAQKIQILIDKEEYLKGEINESI